MPWSTPVVDIVVRTEDSVFSSIEVDEVDREYVGIGERGISAIPYLPFGLIEALLLFQFPAD